MFFNLLFTAMTAALTGASLRTTMQTLEPGSNWRLVLPAAIGSISTFEQTVPHTEFAQRGLSVGSASAWSVVGWELTSRFFGDG